MGIICLADNSHEMSKLISSEKYIYKKKKESGLLQVLFGVFRVKDFYHTWAWWPSCSMKHNILAIFHFPNSRRCHMDFVKTCLVASKEKLFGNVCGQSKDG